MTRQVRRHLLRRSEQRVPGGLISVAGSRREDGRRLPKALTWQPWRTRSLLMTHDAADGRRDAVRLSSRRSAARELARAGASFLAPALAGLCRAHRLSGVAHVLRQLLHHRRTRTRTFVGLANYRELLARRDLLGGGAQHLRSGRSSRRSWTSRPACCWRSRSMPACRSRASCASRGSRPVLLSYVVVGIMWMWIYNYDWGIVNVMLRALGLGALARRPGSATPISRSRRVIVTHAWKWAGFNMVVCLAALHSLPSRGAGSRRAGQLRLGRQARPHHHADAAADAAEPLHPRLHRQDEGVRPGLDHDRRAGRCGRPRRSRPTSTSAPSTGTPSTSAIPSAIAVVWFLRGVRLRDLLNLAVPPRASGWSTDMAADRCRLGRRALPLPRLLSARRSGRRARCSTRSIRAAAVPVGRHDVGAHDRRDQRRSLRLARARSTGSSSAPPGSIPTSPPISGTARWSSSARSPSSRCSAPPPRTALARYRFRGNRLIYFILFTSIIFPPQIILISLYQILVDYNLYNTPLRAHCWSTSACSCR